MIKTSLPLMIGLIVITTACTPETPVPDSVTTTWYQDTDNDGFGDDTTEFTGDRPDTDWIAQGADCNDSDADIHPDATETANLLDDDCDGSVDNGFAYVFVTRNIYSGGFGGLDGADGICQNLASDAGLPGTYKAWLSAGSTAVKYRLNQHDYPYILTTGTQVAANWDDLTDGSLSAKIEYYADGTLSDTPATIVWTSSTSKGDIKTDPGHSVFNSYDCEGYSSGLSGVNAMVGNSGNTSLWSYWGMAECNNKGALYCLQQ